MKLLDATEVKLEWLDMASLTQHPWQPYELIPGSVGVTTILHDLAVQLGKLSSEERGDEYPLRMLIGQGFEAMTAQLYPEMYWQPGVYECDGISGHPDGISLIDGELILEEFKYTHKSLRMKGGKASEWKNILGEWMWMVQVQAYCQLLQAEIASVNLLIGPPIWIESIKMARLHVCWGCGDYQQPFTEKYIRYLIEFDEDELERNWQMLKQHKETMQSRVINNDDVPF